MKPWVTIHAEKQGACAPWHFAKFCVGQNHTDDSQVISVFIGQVHRRDAVEIDEIGPTAETAMFHENLEALGMLCAAKRGYTVFTKFERGESE